jgi:2Fe-2S ferredoxin
MITIRVITREDEEIEIRANRDGSLMELLRGSGIDDISGLCGGCCACATCHIYVSEDYQHILPPMGDHEDSLLDSSDFRRENSRLSCQIKLESNLNGMKVAVAPEE